MNLSLDERETIVTFDEGGKEALVFTYNKAWQRHIEQRLGVKASTNNGYGGREYRLGKQRIRMPSAPRTVTPAQRQHLSEMRAIARNQKMRAIGPIGRGVGEPETSGKGKTITREKQGARTQGRQANDTPGSRQ